MSLEWSHPLPPLPPPRPPPRPPPLPPRPPRPRLLPLAMIALLVSVGGAMRWRMKGRKQRRLLAAALTQFLRKAKQAAAAARVSLPLPGVESTDLPARCLRSRSQSVRGVHAAKPMSKSGKRSAVELEQHSRHSLLVHPAMAVDRHIGIRLGEGRNQLRQVMKSLKDAPW